MNAALFRKTLDCVKQALTDAGLAKADIDDVGLVGGSSICSSLSEPLNTYYLESILYQPVNIHCC